MSLKGFGTEKTGFVEAKYGPFQCSRCEHFISSVNGCTHPAVMADKQVPQENAKLRYARVDPKACCNYWEPEDE